MSIINGALIRALRQIKGIKQTEASKRLRISQQSYSKIEQCKNINGKKLEKVPAALSCTGGDVEEVQKFLPPGDRT